MKNKAIVLLSGGLDSAVTLYIARKKGFKCRCLTFDYGQRHLREIHSAKKIARSAESEWQKVKISLPWKGSSLLDETAKIPLRSASRRANLIPSTYVPGRNIIFLSFALSHAEAVGAESIFIGTHSQDYSGYPDCRLEFYRAFRIAALRGTKAGVEGRPIRIQTPLIGKNKSEIISLGRRLGVPFELTWSCYVGGEEPCGKCDSCNFRAKGFREAGIIDGPFAFAQGHPKPRRSGG